MIGVIADSVEDQVVREFFELFKTPWEYYKRDRRYDVLICAGDYEFEETGTILILYAGRKTEFDGRQKTRTGKERRHACILRRPTVRIPVYGDSVVFESTETNLLSDEESQQCVAYLDRSGVRVLARVGYDLFKEVRTLLSVGQPPANAHIPALELHIALLRDLITGCGLPLAEIPPVPEGYRFIACLTHDVDHPSIRLHKWDHTAFGFLYRAILGSLSDLIARRICFRDLATNWAAALKLSLVYLGLAKDFWRDFDDQYRQVEEGLPSTFFVVPFKNHPGLKSDSPAPASRRTRYSAQDIADTIQRLRAAGCEIALHGIDAWIDSCRGREELEEIRRLTGVPEIGVRMHWLYYDQHSPLTLENAGAAYDSTIGYNETVGYRAGTTQVYKPIEVNRMLELPLHVMDTALFYPAHLGLSQKQAKVLIGAIVDNVVEFGGCLTVNWHDRSLAPERLWGASYRELVGQLNHRGAWFATAAQVTAWFRQRRLAGFERDSTVPGGLRVRVAGDHCPDLPALQVRVHQAQELRDTGASSLETYTDVALRAGVETCVLNGVGR